MYKTFVELEASKEDVIRRALCVLSDDMLCDLVAFCGATEEYRGSDLHELAQVVLRERQLAPIESGISASGR